MPSLSRALLAGAILAWGSTSALATDLLDLEQTVTTPNGVFRIWVGGTYFNAPVANGLGTVGDAGSFLFEQQTDNGAALSNLGASGGLSFWKQTDVNAFYASIDADFVHAVNNYSVTVNVPDGFTFLDSLPITGAPSGGTITGNIPNGSIIDSATTIDYGRVNAAVGMDFGVGGHVPVAFGLFGSVGQLHLVSRVTTAAAPAAFATLDETVNIFSGGPMIAAEWSNPLSDSVDLTLSGRAALLAAFGSLSAAQTAGPGAGTLDLTATANAAALAALAEITATATVAASESLDVFVYGGLGARNDYFSINNPRSAPGLDANDPASYNPGPVSLTQSLLFTAKVGIGVSGTF